MSVGESAGANRVASGDERDRPSRSVYLDCDSLGAHYGVMPGGIEQGMNLGSRAAHVDPVHQSRHARNRYGGEYGDDRERQDQLYDRGAAAQSWVRLVVHGFWLMDCALRHRLVAHRIAILQMTTEPEPT